MQLTRWIDVLTQHTSPSSQFARPRHSTRDWPELHDPEHARSAVPLFTQHWAVGGAHTLPLQSTGSGPTAASPPLASMSPASSMTPAASACEEASRLTTRGTVAAS